MLAALLLPSPVAAQGSPGAASGGEAAAEARPAEAPPLPAPSWWQRLIPGGSRRLSRSGATSWRSGELEEAARDFAAAAALDPENPNRLFDFGTVMAAGGQLQAAEPLLAKAHEGGVEGAAYNSGTAALQLGQAEPAVRWLRQALLAQPDDPDVKRNYELALRLLEQQQQQQQEQEQEQEEQQQDQENQPSPTPSPSPSGAAPTPTPSTNEALFSALDRAEAEAREAMQSPTPSSSSVEKDW
jgi:tetratricopeptide (TPR) repeat protein